MLNGCDGQIGRKKVDTTKKIKRYREMKICRKGLARRGKMRLLNDNLNKLCKLTWRVE